MFQDDFFEKLLPVNLECLQQRVYYTYHIILQTYCNFFHMTPVLSHENSYLIMH